MTLLLEKLGSMNRFLCALTREAPWNGWAYEALLTSVMFLCALTREAPWNVVYMVNLRAIAHVSMRFDARGSLELGGAFLLRALQDGFYAL